MLTQASRQWATRPDDERFLSLDEMALYFQAERRLSHAAVVPSKSITVEPIQGTVAVRRNDAHYEPTHWGFSQLAQLAGVVNASDLRKMHRCPELVADCMNYGLKVYRDVEDVGMLYYRDDARATLRAATGPNYGRVWNADVIEDLRQRFGDGVTGDWKVPGEFGRDVTVTRANTTLYASDRDMFVFLADEKNRVTIPNRRNGQSGSLARGFFVWNSEVGKSTLGLGTFLFDFVCCNRIVWGSEMYQEVRIRHTASANVRWIDDLQPVLLAYSQSSADPIEAKLKAAQAKKISDVEDFMAKRFTRGIGAAISKIHEIEEGKPIETLWDAATAVTAYARGKTHTDARLELERQAGEIISLAA